MELESRKEASKDAKTTTTTAKNKTSATFSGQNLIFTPGKCNYRTNDISPGLPTNRDVEWEKQQLMQKKVE